MHDIRTLIRTAARRLHASAFLASLSQVALVAAGLALLVAVVSKTSPAIDVPWTWLVLGLGVLGFAAALILYSTHRGDEMEVAIEVDERLDLREKFSTALAVAEDDDAFARAAVEDAVEVARDERTRETLKRRFPVVVPPRWWGGPAMAALAIAAAMLLPQGDLFRGEEAVQPTQTVPVEVRQQMDAVVKAIEKNEALESELGELMKELDPNAIDPEAIKSPEDARREALRRMTDVQEKLKEMLEGEKAKTKEVLEKKLWQMKSPQDGPAKEFADALKNADFEGARKALEELQKKAENGELSPEQQRALAEQLENLAKQLDQLAKQQDALERALEQAGLDKSLAQDPQALQQALQQAQNLTQQQKQQLQQMAQAQQQAGAMCKGLGQRLGQMGAKMGSGGQGQGGGQAGQLAQQQLSDMEALASMLQQAQAMNGQLAGMCQGLGQGLGQCQGQGMGMGGQGGAFGGPGRGAGGQAPERRTPFRTTGEKAAEKGQGDIIANTLFDGPQIKGESKAEFAEVARSLEKSYAENVNELQIPRKYHDAIKHFYGKKGLGGRVSGGSNSDAGSDAAEPAAGESSDDGDAG